MYIDFDGHHSGGNSFGFVFKILIILSVGHTHRYQFCFKKKNQVKSPSIYMVLRSGLGSDPLFGSGRDSGRDMKGYVATIQAAKLWHTEPTQGYY